MDMATYRLRLSIYQSIHPPSCWHYLDWINTWSEYFCIQKKNCFVFTDFLIFRKLFGIVNTWYVYILIMYHKLTKNELKPCFAILRLFVFEPTVYQFVLVIPLPLVSVHLSISRVSKSSLKLPIAITVQCTVHCVMCTVYSTVWAVYSVHYWLRAVYSVHYWLRAVYSIHYWLRAVYSSVQCTVCCVQCTVQCRMCTVYSTM